MHPPPRTQTGTLGQFISEKSAPNHPGKGLDPPQNEGQCPNAWGDFFGGASLISAFKHLSVSTEVCVIVYEAASGDNFALQQQKQRPKRSVVRLLLAAADATTAECYTAKAFASLSRGH